VTVLTLAVVLGLLQPFVLAATIGGYRAARRTERHLYKLDRREAVSRQRLEDHARRLGNLERKTA